MQLAEPSLELGGSPEPAPQPARKLSRLRKAGQAPAAKAVAAPGAELEDEENAAPNEGPPPADASEVPEAAAPEASQGGSEGSEPVSPTSQVRGAPAALCRVGAALPPPLPLPG